MTTVRATEPSPQHVEVTGPDEVRWSTLTPNGADEIGVFRSAFDGTGAALTTSLIAAACTSFAWDPAGVTYYVHPNASDIRREQGQGFSFFALSPNIVNVMQKAGAELVWTDAKSIRKKALADIDAAAGTPLATASEPYGVAVAGPWVYVTDRSGAVVRARLDGSGAGAAPETVYDPGGARPESVGDIDVSADGKRAYYAVDSTLFGLALPP